MIMSNTYGIKVDTLAKQQQGPRSPKYIFLKLKQ